MKQRKLIAFAFSIIFTLVFSLVMIALPTNVALADQVNDIPKESVKTQSTSDVQKNPDSVTPNSTSTKEDEPKGPKSVPEQCNCIDPQGRHGIMVGNRCVPNPICNN